MTVSWDGSTAILDTRSSSRSDIRTGTCVVGSTASAAPGQQHTGPGGADQVVWALVSAPLDGQCPTTAPQAPGAAGAARVISGLVTGVDGSLVTLQTVGVGRPKAQVRIALTSGAAVVRTVDAAASAVRRGRCVVAEGTRDALGRLVATSLTLSDAGRSGCP
ncbi:MAG TPA: hypothetical protein VFM07_08850 [Intrasporangium sp.]|nr:hypothetical protein [Intrasporangium sp.]